MHKPLIMLRFLINFTTQFVLNRNSCGGKFAGFNTRCVRKVSDLRSYLRVGAILRHPDSGVLRSSPHLVNHTLPAVLPDLKAVF